MKQYTYRCPTHATFDTTERADSLPCPTCQADSHRLWGATPLASTCHPTRGRKR